MNSVNPEEIEELIPFGNKVPEYDNTYTLWGLQFDGPEIKMDQEVGYLDNAEDRERKQKAAAAARERYHKMTPEERYARNQKRRAKDVADDVGIQKEMIQKPAQTTAKVQKSVQNQKIHPNGAKKKQNAHEQMARAAAARERYHKMTPEERYAKNQKKRHREVSDDVGIQKIQKPAQATAKVQKPVQIQKISPNGAKKKQNADENIQTTSEPVKRPTRYQRKTFDERKTFNKKKTDAKRAKKEQVEREEKKEEEESDDPTGRRRMQNGIRKNNRNGSVELIWRKWRDHSVFKMRMM